MNTTATTKSLCFDFRDFTTEDHANHQDAEPITPEHPARIAETNDWIITCYGRTDGRAAAKVDIFHQHSDLGYAQKFDSTDDAIWTSIGLRQNSMDHATLLAAGFHKVSGEGNEAAAPGKVHEGSMTFSRFTKLDWSTYAGAELLHDGTDPLIAQRHNHIFAIAGTTQDARAPQPVQLEIFTSDLSGAYSQTFDCLGMALFVASHLTPEDLTPTRLEQLGFFCHFR